MITMPYIDIHKKTRSGNYGFLGIYMKEFHAAASLCIKCGFKWGVFCMKIIPIFSFSRFNNHHSPSVKCRDMHESIPSIHDNDDNDEEIILWLCKIRETFRVKRLEEANFLIFIY